MIRKFKKLKKKRFAMLPFCGYHMADYFGHWIDVGKKHADQNHLPKIFNVNWFKTNSEGNFLWPGYGENSRVLKWIFERVDDEKNNQNAIETPIGIIPKLENFDYSNLDDVNKETMNQLFKIDKKEWLAEVEENSNYFNKTFGRRLPKELRIELNNIKKRLDNYNN